MKDLIRSVFNIFRWTGKILTGIRIFTLNALFLIFLFFLFSALSSYAPRKDEKVFTSGALILRLTGDIVEERQPTDLFSNLLSEIMGLENLASETLLQDILDVIAEAAIDDRVSCILLDLGDMGSVGLDQLQSIGTALSDFRGSGKKVIAAEDFYPQKAYYLASYADEVYLNPMGGVDLHGIGAYRLYFKDAIDKLKINYNIFRVGTFKSATEPLMRNSMSEEARTQNLSWLTPLWDTITTDITRERHLQEDTIRTYTENIASELATAGGDLARLALETGLVDGLMTNEQLRNHLATLSGKDAEGDFKRIGFNDYLGDISPSFVAPSEEENGVGIIIAQGAILNGEQPIGLIGGVTMANLIRKARQDANIKALVLRIISGGGSVFASEQIRQEIIEFKKTGKPLVVSMGAMAASGGYWIAADADEIWASPTTLTGSIGIFAAIPTFENSLSEMGVYNDGVGTTSLAAALDLTRPMSPLLKEAIELNLHHGYDRFLNIVAEGRSMDRKKVAQIAEGKVFDGRTARDLGLVDKLGSMEEAISSAADHAGLSDYRASYIRKPLTVKDEILQIFSGRIGSFMEGVHIGQPLRTVLTRLLSPIREILLFDDPLGLYVHSMLHEFSL